VFSPATACDNRTVRRSAFDGADIFLSSRWWESNPRPDDYKSPALPLRHTGVAVHATAGCDPPDPVRRRHAWLVGHGGETAWRGILASRLAHWQAGQTMALNDRDLQILDFEQSWWTRPEKKAVAIRTRFGISPTQYYRQLDLLVDSGPALERFPLLVRRLRRRRLERRRGRYETTPEQQHPRR
jgi:Protein of unknown function (DUF3263)